MFAIPIINAIGNQIPDEGDGKMAGKAGGDKLKVTQTTKATGQVNANDFNATVAGQGGGAGKQGAGKQSAGKQTAGKQKAG
jgi:hypothetical protein